MKIGALSEISTESLQNKKQTSSVLRLLDSNGRNEIKSIPLVLAYLLSPSTVL
jgi:hypothetical protein